MIGLLLCSVLFAVGLYLLIGAVILRAACAAYNKLSMPENHVEEPGIGKGMGILFVALLVQGVAVFALGKVLGVGGGIGNGPGFAADRNAQMMTNLIGLPLQLLVMAGLLTAMLPTTFGRAILITLLYTVIAVLIFIVIGLLIFVLMLAGGFGGR